MTTPPPKYSEKLALSTAAPIITGLPNPLSAKVFLSSFSPIIFPFSSSSQYSTIPGSGSQSIPLGPDQTLPSTVPSSIENDVPLSIQSNSLKIRPLISCIPRTPAICTISPFCNNGFAGFPLLNPGSLK